VIDAEVDMIDSVYNATSNGRGFAEAHQNYLRLQGDLACTMAHYDTTSKENTNIEVFSLDDSLSQIIADLASEYTKSGGILRNPVLAAGHQDLIAGKLVVSDKVLPFSELSKTQYYKTLYQPFGVRQCMGWTTVGTQRYRMMNTSAREGNAGEYTDLHLHRGKLFQRHMTRAIHLLELRDEARSTFEKSIEQLPHGVILLDDDRRISFRNRLASRLIQDLHSLTDNHDILTVGATCHDREKFNQWWKILVVNQASDGACFRNGATDPVWQIDVSRVAPGDDRTARGRRWMLTLKLHPDGDQIQTDYLIKRFGLTRSEAAVCKCLCHYGDAVSTAKALGVSPNTVRTHLKSAFRKTGTRNQIELAICLISKNPDRISLS